MVASFLIGQNALTIGQMTKPIEIKDVLRGQEVQATLNLFGEEDKETAYDLSAGGDIASWATFYAIDNLQNPITQIKIPAQGKVDAIVKFKVPEDTPNGLYVGQVILMTAIENESNKEGISASVGMSVGREVSIIVTDKEIVNFETSIIPLTYGVKRGEPLQIKVIYENRGNVTVKPDLQLKILKDNKVIFNAIFPYPENFEPLKPQERKELPNLIEWQTKDQENDDYRAELTILLKGEVIKNDFFRFTISDRGFVLGIKSMNLRVIWPIIAVVVGIGLILGIVLKIRKIVKNRKSQTDSTQM